jgi:hypothetical protein
VWVLVLPAYVQEGASLLEIRQPFFISNVKNEIKAYTNRSEIYIINYRDQIEKKRFKTTG